MKLIQNSHIIRFFSPLFATLLVLIGIPGNASDTVTINHVFGSTKVPVNAKKFATSVNYGDTLYALDIEPTILLTRGNMIPPWLSNKYHADKTQLISLDTFSLPTETVLRNKPEVILGGGLIFKQEYYDTLSRLAPTIPNIKDKTIPDDWVTVANVAGKITNQQTKINQIISNVNQKINNLARQNSKNKGKTFAIIAPVSSGPIIVKNSKNDASVHLLEQLGLRMEPSLNSIPKTTVMGVENYAISLENINKINNADLIIVMYADKDYSAVINNPLFKKLKAAKKGNVVKMDLAQTASLYYTSVLSVPYFLDFLAPHLKSL